MIAGLTWICLVVAGISCCAFVLNAIAFRRLPSLSSSERLVSVSVLIPARDEADGIADCVNAVLQSQGVEVEVVVLDDQSSDDTAAIIESMAASEDGIRLIRGDALPDGWCGKQYACWQLAEAARHDWLLFIDADVRLDATAVARVIAKSTSRGLHLLSGFPRQLTRTLGERLLIPQMYLVLLTYLPFVLMRYSSMESAAAGCGQLMLCRRDAYFDSEGHRAIRHSLHDGLQLPQAFRKSGYRTDVFDASDMATCRMYEGFSATWAGVLKNAHEGIANPIRILPFTVLMVFGYVLPAVLVVVNLFYDQTLSVAVVATIVSLVPWAIIGWRFNRIGFVTLLLPVAVVLFLAIQWQSLWGRYRGQQSTWRGRQYS